MAVPSPSSKRDLRTEALRRRRIHSGDLDPAARHALEARLADRVAPHLGDARFVAAYDPLPDEIDPSDILARLEPGQCTAFPWFAQTDAPMNWRAGACVRPGPWGTVQPDDEAPLIVPDLFIVPMVLADRSGVRIGRGGGHYDRALEAARAKGPVFAIGIGWDFQLVDGLLPADPWDARLDAVATPDEWVDCR